MRIKSVLKYKDIVCNYIQMYSYYQAQIMYKKIQDTAWIQKILGN